MKEFLFRLWIAFVLIGFIDGMIVILIREVL